MNENEHADDQVRCNFMLTMCSNHVFRVSTVYSVRDTLRQNGCVHCRSLAAGIAHVNGYAMQASGQHFRVNDNSTDRILFAITTLIAKTKIARFTAE